ncbi:MAG: hypothetical protein PVH79_03430 [Candidatus Bathyarchaeota archaeon]
MTTHHHILYALRLLHVQVEGPGVNGRPTPPLEHVLAVVKGPPRPQDITAPPGPGQRTVSLVPAQTSGLHDLPAGHRSAPAQHGEDPSPGTPKSAHNARKRIIKR